MSNRAAHLLPADKITRRYIDGLSDFDLKALVGSMHLRFRPALDRYASQVNVGRMADADMAARIAARAAAS